MRDLIHLIENLNLVANPRDTHAPNAEKTIKDLMAMTKHPLARKPSSHS